MIKFANEHNAIMWISTKALLAEDEKYIAEIIEKKLKNKENKIAFLGFCFGRFDLIVEFKETSAKVASNVVCELQEDIVTFLRKRRKGIEKKEIIFIFLLYASKACESIFKNPITTLIK